MDTRKKSFLNSGYPLFSSKETHHQLNKDNLIALAKHYLEKRGVNIFICGQTPEGKACIDKARKPFLAQLDALRDDRKKYATYIINNWCGKGIEKRDDFFIGRSLRSDFSDVYNQMFMKLHEANFLRQNCQTIVCESDVEFERLNHLFDDAADVLKLLDVSIKKKVHKLTIQIENESFLTHHSYIIYEGVGLAEEVAAIQSRLSPDEAVGYIYINSRRIEGEHADALIITKNSLIRPIDWSGWQGLYRNVSLSTAYIPAIHVPPHSEVPSPQAHNQRFCGTLGMLYLKELLKDNAYQLNYLTLNFTWYNKIAYLLEDLMPENKCTQFFFPSPQVLRYSQSAFYRDIFHAMLFDSSEPVTVVSESGNKKLVVPTIKLMLEETLVYLNGEGQTVENKDQWKAETQLLLDRLPAFREAWLKEYELTKEKITAMRKDGKNHYLAYSVSRMFDILEGNAGVSARI